MVTDLKQASFMALEESDQKTIIGGSKYLLLYQES